MPAQDTTVFQFNFKVGQDLHNVYATNGAEALELLDFFQESLLSRVAEITAAATAAFNVAPLTQAAPALPPIQPVAQPYAQQAAPPAQGGHVCAHGEAMKLVPAGVSKASGRPYKAFYACARPRNEQCDTKVTVG